MKTSKLLIPAILLLSGTMLLASCQPKKGGNEGQSDEETSEPAGQSEEDSEPAGGSETESEPVEKTLVPQKVNLKLRENQVYFVVSGTATGYTQAELQGANIDYQHHGGVCGDNNWGFAENVSQTGDGFAADYAALGTGNTYEVGWNISGRASLKTGLAYECWIIHWHKLALDETTTQRHDINDLEDLANCIAADYAPITLGDFKYEILQSADTWGNPTFTITDNTKDRILNSSIEADSDGVYYVVNGYAGPRTQAQLLTSTIMFSHNSNLDGQGWDTVVQDQAATKAVIDGNGYYKVSFRVDNVAAVKPTADDATWVFTTKVKIADGNLLEMKFPLASDYAAKTADGYEYSITKSDATWTIASLTVKKLAAA